MWWYQTYNYYNSGYAAPMQYYYSAPMMYGGYEYMYPCYPYWGW